MKDAVYFELPKHNLTLTEVQGIFCFDQQKWNLFGLAEPRVDSEGVEAARKSVIAYSIHERMFTQLREALKLPPIKFIHHWKSMYDLTSEMTREWPDGFDKTIEQRARTLWELGRYDNIVEVNFMRRAG